ncbi:YjcZ family sporulation protein [Neobacillus sp. C211]
MLSGQNYPVSPPWSGSFAIIVVLFIPLIINVFSHPETLFNLYTEFTRL